MNWQKWTSLVIVLSATTAAMAVKTNYWTDSQSTHFKAGKTENVVISNFNRITLGPATTELLAGRTDASLIFDIKVLTDGSILAATGSEGRILIYRNKKWEIFYTADQPYVFALEVDKSGKIYAGTGGSVGKVIEISANGKESKVLFTNEKAQYIWKLKVLSDGRVAAATGPNGKLFLIDKTGSKEIFSCKQKNLQALAVGKDDAIYVGTDSDAIIYKIQEHNGEFTGRAIYDAKEKEISVLEIDPQGNLFAATASGIQGKDQAKSYLTKPQGTPVSTSPATSSSTSSAPTTQETEGDSSDEGETLATNDGEETPTAPPMPPMMPGMPPMPVMSGEGASEDSGPTGQNNAIYRIDEMGFVTEVFRDKVDINAMVLDQGTLYLGTGPDGRLFKVNPAVEEVILSVKTETKNINAIAFTADGAMILGTATPAKVVRVESKPAAKGTFTSKVFDAGQIARWGMINATPVNAESAGCCGTVQTRSSVIANPDDPGWSPWSTPADIKTPSHITSPAGRYLQYRLTFENNEATPAIIDKVQIAWMQDNRAPQVTAVTVNTGGSGSPGAETSEGEDEGSSETPPMPMMPTPAKKANKQFRFNWKASDPNGDQMRYTVSLRRTESPYWVELQKDFIPMMMTWDSQSVPDGRYELKVLAADKLDNPVGMGLTGARVSDTFTVDNTPPEVRDLKCSLTSEGKILIEANLVDELSEISGAWVTINAGREWQYLAPADELYDSKTERIEAVLPIRTKNKPTMITIKTDDRSGNTGFGWELLTK